MATGMKAARRTSQLNTSSPSGYFRALPFGTVVVDRLAYRHRGSASLCPADGVLSLPLEQHPTGCASWRPSSPPEGPSMRRAMPSTGPRYRVTSKPAHLTTTAAISTPVMAAIRTSGLGFVLARAGRCCEPDNTDSGDKYADQGRAVRATTRMSAKSWRGEGDVGGHQGCFEDARAASGSGQPRPGGVGCGGATAVPA